MTSSSAARTVRVPYLRLNAGSLSVADPAEMARQIPSARAALACSKDWSLQMRLAARAEFAIRRQEHPMSHHEADVICILVN